MNEQDSNPSLRLETKRTNVRVYTSTFVIEGTVHTRPGGFQNRVLDILNSGKINFMPITNARYTDRDGGEPIDSECVIVNIKDIEVIQLIH